MSFQILYGLCEENKTEYVFSIMKKALSDSNCKIVYLVPEQFSFRSEQKTAEVLGCVNNLNINVLSFKGLASKVFAKYGPVHLLVPGDEAREVLMQKVMLDLENQLDFFSSFCEKDSFSGEILGLIDEFQRYNVDQICLESIISKTENSDFKAKLSDIKKIFSEYIMQFEQYYKQSETMLKILKYKILQFGAFQGYTFIIDGFNDFTEEEFDIVEQIIVNAEKVILCLNCYSLEPGKSPYGALFDLPVKTAARITAIARKNDVEVLLPEKIPESQKSTNVIHYLTRNFFNYKAHPFTEHTDKIKIFTALNSYYEVEALAVQILKLVRENGLNFSDILIAARDLQKYTENIKYVFAKYSIPFIIDYERPVADFEIPSFFLRLVGVFSENFSLDSVLNYLKSPYSDVPENALYIFENYCVSKGIGRKHLSDCDFLFQCLHESPQTVDALNRVKLQHINPLIQLWAEIKSKSAGCMIRDMYVFFENSGIKEKLELRMKNFYSVGELRLCAELQRSYDALIDVLDCVYYILNSSKSLRIRLLYDVLKTALMSKKINLSLFSDDHVRVSNIDLFRTDAVKCLIIIGAVAEELPRAYKTEGILTDKERDFFSENQIKLSPSNKVKQLNEDLVVYKCFSSASEYLFLFVPLYFSDGSALEPSPVVSGIKKIFPNLEIFNYSLDSSEPEQLLNSLEALLPTLDILVDKMILCFSGGDSLGQLMTGDSVSYAQKTEQSVKLFWQNLAYWYSVNHPRMLEQKLHQANCCLAMLDKSEGLSSSVAGMIYDNYTVSVSKIEQYIRCPYAFFVKYILRASGNTENILAAPDVGVIMHEAVERFFRDFSDVYVGFDSMSKDDIFINSLKIARQIADEKAQTLNLKTSYAKWLFSRVSNTLYTAMLNIVDFYRQTGVKSLSCEFQFNSDDFKSIDVDIGRGVKKSIVIKGKIDRVDVLDLCGRKFIGIADYKTGAKNLEYSELLNGIGLQLPVYLKMICDKYHGKYQPMYMLYCNLNTPLADAFPEESDDRIWEKLRSELKMNGIVNKGLFKQLESSSDFVSCKKQFDTDKFKTLFDFTEGKIRSIFKKMLSGDISPFPCSIDKNTSCSYCEYRGVCGFGVTSEERYRYVSRISDEDFFESIFNSE